MNETLRKLRAYKTVLLNDLLIQLSKKQQEAFYKRFDALGPLVIYDHCLIEPIQFLETVIHKKTNFGIGDRYLYTDKSMSGILDIGDRITITRVPAHKTETFGELEICYDFVTTKGNTGSGSMTVQHALDVLEYIC